MAFGDTCGMGSVCCPADCNFTDVYLSICFDRDIKLELNTPVLIDVTAYWQVHGVTAPPGELRNKTNNLEVTLTSQVFNPANYTIDYVARINGVFDIEGTPKQWRAQDFEITWTWNCNAPERGKYLTFDRDFITNKDEDTFLMDCINGLPLWLSNQSGMMQRLPSRGGCQEASLYYWGGWNVLVETNPSAADIVVKYGWDPATQQSKNFVQLAGDKVWLEIETKASDDDYEIILEWNPFYFCLDETVTNPLSVDWEAPVYDPALGTTYVVSPPGRTLRDMWVYLTLVDRVRVDCDRIKWDYGVPLDIMYNLYMKSGDYVLDSTIAVGLI